MKKNLVIHLCFAGLLLAIIALKYTDYKNAHPMTEARLARHIGAALSVFLIWACGYGICLATERKILLGSLATISLLLGTSTVPLFGWLGVITLYIIHRRTKSSVPPNH